MVVEDQFEQKSVPNVIADSFFKSEEDKRSLMSYLSLELVIILEHIGLMIQPRQEFKIPAFILKWMVRLVKCYLFILKGV